jgi:hypothetical protein
MKSYALGLLLLGSFNVLGKECAIKTSNQSTYTILDFAWIEHFLPQALLSA